MNEFQQLLVLCKVYFHSHKITTLKRKFPSLQHTLHSTIENCSVGKLWSFFVSETTKMSNLVLINPSIGTDLFLNELTWRWLSVIFFEFSNLTFLYFGDRRVFGSFFWDDYWTLWDSFISNVIQNWINKVPISRKLCTW